MRKSLIGLALALSSTPALALDIYNKDGSVIAEYAGMDYATNSDLVTATINGQKHLIAVSANGPIVNTLFYFSQPGCNGPPLAGYNPNIQLLPRAIWDGQAMWAVQTSTASIYLLASVKDTNGCHEIGRVPINSAGAIEVFNPFADGIIVPDIYSPNYSPP